MGNTIDPSSVRLELNQKFDLLPIFKRDRSTALYHLCAALEMSTNPYTVDPDLAMAMGRRVLEASMRAIPGIDRNCPGVAAPLGAQFNSAAFAEAMELVEFAFRYEQIMYCFQLADRGQFQVRYDPLEQRTVFTYASVIRALRIPCCAATKEIQTSSGPLRRTKPSSFSSPKRRDKNSNEQSYLSIQMPFPIGLPQRCWP
jgi:hypothetical protein